MPLVKIQNLSKTFHTANGDVQALKNINLSIEQGDIFGIIGLSGAGKSTLVRCINFLEIPTEGTVFFEGKDLTALTHKELLKARQSMGMIFQGFNLLEQRTAIKNICFPLEIAGVPKKDAEKRARELLKIVGLEDREKSYPSQLSGGQKQRVAIARALATNPKVLLCDEATSALDPNTTRSILALLKEINETMGVTVIIITHEMSVIEQICNRVAVIDKSRIVEEGSVKEIFANPQSDMAKQLILPKNAIHSLENYKTIRIVFDGLSSYEPVIANLIMECNVPANIMYANTKDVNGMAAGEMIIQVPDTAIDKVSAYFDRIGIKYKEEM